MLSNFGHTTELLFIACTKIEERELVEVSKFLVCHLDSLVVAVYQSLGAQTSPDLGSVEFFCHLSRNLQVSAFDCQFEACLRVLDELKSYLGISLLLEVRYDALAHKSRRLDDL